MALASVAAFACLILTGSALTREAIVEHDIGSGGGIEVGGGVEIEIDDLLADKPKKHNDTKTREAIKKLRENLTASLDQVIPVLEADFKTKTEQLKLTLANFKSKQKAMDMAKMEATQAMKALRKEAEKRRKLANDRKKVKEIERQAKDEAKRAAKEAMLKKANSLMGAKTAEGTLNNVAMSMVVDVLMALPGAVDSPIFIKRLEKSKVDVVGSVQDFLNMTRRKTAKFVLASSKASDVELSFLMARYFHEASFRVKAMQSDGEKIARDLNVVMPKELRQSFLPIVRGVRANAVPLKVNASSLASASLAEACSQISGLMANISFYNNKLSAIHTTLHNVWQISELMLPHMSKVYPMKPMVVETVKDFMSLATIQVAALQESADEIVTNVGPVVAERMQCTWSAAPARYSIGFVTALFALASHLFV